MPILPNSCVICFLYLNSQTMATESCLSSTRYSGTNAVYVRAIENTSCWQKTKGFLAILLLTVQHKVSSYISGSELSYALMIYTTQNVEQSNIKQQRAKIQLPCAPLCLLYQSQILIFCARCR